MKSAARVMNWPADGDSGAASSRTRADDGSDADPLGGGYRRKGGW